LNSTKGPRSYEEIRTVNGITYRMFKHACYTLGLLNDDNEWNDAIQGANHWVSPSQLCELFVAIHLFCEVSDPCLLWNTNATLLFKDILYNKRKFYEHLKLILSEEQINSRTLPEITKILNRYGKCLVDFSTLPQPSYNAPNG